MNPFDVLMSIQQDPSVSLVEESNPIHNLKEKENVTYSGVGVVPNVRWSAAPVRSIKPMWVPVLRPRWTPVT